MICQSVIWLFDVKNGGCGAYFLNRGPSVGYLRQSRRAISWAYFAAVSINKRSAKD
jgi:hypothetical protein